MIFINMVNNLLKLLKEEGINDDNVLNSIKNIPRENFVLEEYKKNAYSDIALPIVSGQTISQPYTAAFMLQKLELKKGDKVLEIGAGSGWNSALINYITKNIVYTVEFNENVAVFAANNLKKFKDVKLIIGDGNKGYEKERPYDKIIVTAACSKMPFDLVKQLKNNGILLVPVGNLSEQNLLKITKIDDEIIKENLGKFVFVPLKGKYGF